MIPTPAEQHMQQAIIEVCKHLATRLAMEVTYDEKYDVDAHRAITNAMSLVAARKVPSNLKEPRPS